VIDNTVRICSGIGVMLRHSTTLAIQVLCLEERNTAEIKDRIAKQVASQNNAGHCGRDLTVTGICRKGTECMSAFAVPEEE